MDQGKKKSDASKKAPVGTIALSLAIGAVIGSVVTYSSVSKPPPAPPAQSSSSPSSPSFGGAPQTMTIPPQQQGFTPAPQPPGEVPPGKVWSAEHGHWHDAPVGLTVPAPTLSTPPAAPAPAGTNE